MKKNCTLLLAILCCSQIFAQGGAKKYMLFEIFSNTTSTTMAGKMPTFYVLLDKYPNDVRHITYYYKSTNDSCFFYQSNKVENDERAKYYGVSIIPWVMRDAGLLGLPLGKDLVNESSVTGQLGKTSPIKVTVSETGTTNRTAKITVSTVGKKPTGTFKLFSAVVEKTVAQETKNGELEHRNVFRTMLPTIAGQDIVLPDSGQSVTYDYNYVTKSEWNPSEIYVEAFVQTKNAVQNVGTRFDGTSSTNELLDESVLEVFPNPVQQVLNLKWKDSHDPEILSIYSINGNLVKEVKFANQVDVGALPSGNYFIHVSAGKYGVIKQIVKQ